MIVLGVTGPLHDTSAALLVDGEVVAAAEEERFTRLKHGVRQPACHSVRYCLDEAGIAASDVDVVAHPWSSDLVRRNRWRNWRRHVRYDPLRETAGLLKVGRRYRRRREKVQAALGAVGLDLGRTAWVDVEHHVAHAASAFLFAPFEDCAVLTVDGGGEYVTTQVGHATPEGFEVTWRAHMPDSLGCFYATMTQYLGWDFNDGEYKLMGMAAYGDPDAVDLDGIAWLDADGAFHMDPEVVWVPRARRWQGRRFSRRLVERLGPPREGDGLDAPYVHVAAATQRLFERAVLALVDGPLAAPLGRSPRLAYAGGCALNVALNRHLVAHPKIDRLWVQPAANDAGTSLGAAAWAAWQRDERPRPMTHPYLGPAFDEPGTLRVLQASGLRFEALEDVAAAAADLLAAGEVVAWFQGRMEFGPRALGNRSILGHPGRPGTSDRINAQIKFRETWRPFCPAVLDTHAEAILGSAHPAAFMTIGFEVAPAWRERLAEVVHVNGTIRPQVVSADTNPGFHRLLTAFAERTGLPVLINTSLNRRGEPMVCTPEDALRMFQGSGLTHLVIGNFLVTKPDA